MLFNSHEYLLLFLPISLIVYFGLNRLHLTLASKLWLVVTSLFFYAWWNPKYLPLLLASILINFSIGTALSRSAITTDLNRKALLIFGICVNVILLGYYKYTDFVLTNLNQFFHSGFKLQHIILPIGISFFTFTQIAYLVDAYRRTVKEYDLLNYSLFVSFFPHLLAGPIIHHKEMMPQFSRIRNSVHDYRHLMIGLCLLFAGLVKKVMIADRLGGWAGDGFDIIPNPTLLHAWAISLCYTFQIYFDFSGYTDMALGAALMFNIKLPVNFNSPYKSLDIQEFWRRWHITLGRFLREYIYVPLGGNRAVPVLVCVNLMVTFLIGGIWHGAAWTFLVWGGLHGAAIVIHYVWKKANFRLPTVLAWLVTFNFINFTWIFFRARDWGAVAKILRGMIGLNGVVFPEEASKFLAPLGIGSGHFMEWEKIMVGSRDAWIYIPGALIFCLVLKNTNQIFERMKPDWRVLILIVLGAYTILNMSHVSEFLYFNF
jgi:alginate O-acetyltransferase complex protein AlgI